MKKLAAVLGLGLWLGGCATAPEPKYAGIQQSKDVSRDLIIHLVCEIQGVDGASLKALKGETPAGKPYVVIANLSVKAATGGGATPSLNFVTTLHGAESRNTIFGAELSSAATKTVSQNFAIDLSKVQAAKCDKEHDKFTGSFGVDKLIAQAMKRDLPEAVALVNVKDLNFGSTIEFSIEWGFTGGPSWVLTHFKGPNDKGLINASRTDTSTLVIAFSRPNPTAAAEARKANPPA
jgi:hypothetical protein